MKRYSKPTTEVIDLKARNLLDVTIGAHSTYVPQEPGGSSGGLSKPTVIQGGHLGGTSNYWDD